MTEAIMHDAGAIGATDGRFGRLRKAIADYRLYRATVNELAQLTDRELTDLGLHRASIREIARQTVYGA